MNINDGNKDWEMDFSNRTTTTFGLIIINNKLYLFTDKDISQLDNE